EGWAKMPEGRTWGATSAVDIDRDGTSIWVAERCGANSCLGSDLPVMLKFDRDGRLVTSFARGLMIFPHGIHVDRDGNIWVTDGQDNRPRRPRGAAPDTPLPPAPSKLIGHQVFKFSPDGTRLLTLGAAGGGTGAEGFYQPNDIVTDTNGDIYVAEGHGGNNARIVVFDRTGKYLREFGKKGAGPGEFDQPHGLAFDSKGRLFVADRSNNRIQIVDKNGTFLEEWHQFSRPSGIFIDGNDMMYVADSESGSVGSARSRTDWPRGIRVGSIRDGKVIALIPDPEPNPPSTSSAEGVAVDAAGNIYGAEVGQRALKKYVKADR
ncbi:MAG TPA: peptidyl-alpha-hydroxyglycine alpha-amidating lyase family protein, partial [Vicinamibacterales bacterium]|nr:peptidyl-alpha-hydroxyglycine alpha-amidating lyase family protein [Vicinamibacterales bacterium]